MTADITPIIVGAAVTLFVALGGLMVVLFTWTRADIREVRQDVKEVRQDVKGILKRLPTPEPASGAILSGGGLSPSPEGLQGATVEMSLAELGSLKILDVAATTAYRRVIAEMAAREAAREAAEREAQSRTRPADASPSGA